MKLKNDKISALNCVFSGRSKQRRTRAGFSWYDSIRRELHNPIQRQSWTLGLQGALQTVRHWRSR